MQIFSLLGFMVGTLIIGSIGVIWTAPAVSTWYRTLKMPSWNPPSWLFGPVWTVLYLMMGFAAWLVWSKSTNETLPVPMVLYALQLGLNVLWSYLFFGKRRADWAFYEIIVLWIVIIGAVFAFFQVSPAAGVLILPYLAWVSFAMILNGTIHRMNRFSPPVP